MTYEQAIEEYDALDDDGKSKTLYAHFGLAVYFAQLLEQQAINMIVIKHIADKKVKSQDHLDKLWQDYDMGRKTLGPLIKELSKLYTFSDELASDLDEVLKLRNYIAHDYFRLNGEILQSDQGRRRMIKDFVEFRIKAKAVDVRLEEILDQINEKLGMTKEKLAEEMEALKRDSVLFAADPNYKTVKK
jgi:hypothetical protein